MSKVVFVVGRRGSGKTTVCNHLNTIGFLRVSASDCLRELYETEFTFSPSIISLADYGLELMKRNYLQDFHRLLAARLKKPPACSIDGLRFEQSVEILAREVDRSAIVFLHCPTSIRRERVGASEEFEKMELHKTEVSIDILRDKADIVLDTSKSREFTFASATSQLEKLGMINTIVQ